MGGECIATSGGQTAANPDATDIHDGCTPIADA